MGPTTRRAFLASGLTGASIGTAGCLDRIPLLGGEQPPPFGPVEHGWGMAGRDAANTAVNPKANGPTDDPDIIWEYDIGEKHPGADSMLSVLAEP